MRYQHSKVVSVSFQTNSVNLQNIHSSCFNCFQNKFSNMLQYYKNVLSTLRIVSCLPKLSQPCLKSSDGFCSLKVRSQSKLQDLQFVRSFHATKPNYKWFEREERKEYAINTEELKDLVEKDQVFLIDLREAQEVAAGRVLAKRYLHIPLGEFIYSLYSPEEEFAKKYGVSLPKDATDVVLMCRGGIRSTFALQIMQHKGFPGAKHYLDGWRGWENALSKK